MPSGEGPSRVIFLNGTSSAGKTTLARAIQDESEVPFVYWGIDTLFGLVPPKWGGGVDGPLSRKASGTTAGVPIRTDTRGWSSATAR
ncbi:phosphotransferase-like protein [Nocardia asteroides]|uniref:phosphotransferase-like protein n=1 Tax=Nocardia asteroides TaxID=1824 RepID=UPI003407D5D9